MFAVNQLSGFWAAEEPPAGGSIALTYISQNSSATDAASYDFGNFNAPTGGLMIAVVLGRQASGTRTIDSVSIGGSLGTLHTNPTGNNAGAVASRVVSSGNNNVTVTSSGGSLGRCAVIVYLLTGYSSATPFDTFGNATAVTGFSIAATLDLASGGVAVFGAMDAGVNAIGWSSATEDVEFTTESSNFAGAHLTGTGAETNHVETASWGNNVANSIFAASWL